MATKNQKTDILIQQEDNVHQQDTLTKEYRNQVILPAKNLSPCIQEELAKADLVITLIKPPQETESLLLTDRILQTNQDSPSLQELRKQASKKNGIYSLKDSLLLANSHVIVPDQDDLQTLIVKKAYTQRITAYPSQKKTAYILRDQYY